MEKKTYTTKVGGKEITAQFSDLAMHANGSCLVTCGGTTVLATAVQSKGAREGIDFFPLVVDYEEKFYAAGKILGSRFMRREGKASDEATLVSRLIDRGIRPLFNQKTRNEVQIIILALSIDEDNDPDVLAILAGSLALATSDIAWSGPLGGVRIGKIDDKIIINPTYKEREESQIDTVICGKDGNINMIEAGANEVTESDMKTVLESAQKEIDALCEFQKNIVKDIGKEKTEISIDTVPQELRDIFKKHIAPDLEEAIYIKEKQQRYEALNEQKRLWVGIVESEAPDTPRNIADWLFEETVDDVVHKNIIEHDKRPDGRGMSEIRHLSANTGILPRTHGSGLFYRGETHVLSVVTLGLPSDAQLVEGMEVRMKKRFMHHYNFPPFAPGEVKPMRGPGRREIGHGALAERAIAPMIPNTETFPYTIRVVSECLSSNGSTSMASVCGSTLALMDAGVPIKKPVAGMAMGLMLSEAKFAEGGMPKYKILTDIQGPEDHHGDMDFKVAGTADGITAVQMDVKVDGIPLNILVEAFEQARKARLEALSVMLKEISEPRANLNKYAPRILIMKIDEEKIRDLIGPGGKMIQSIIAETETQIDIEQDGTVFVAATNQENIDKAKTKIEALTKVFEEGEIYEGPVTRLFPFGVMVEIAPGQEGLVHISEMAPFRVNEVTDMVAPGDIVPVKVIGKDEKGRINLSIKAVRELKPKPENERVKMPPQEPRRSNNGFRRNNHR
jgi:polyribonucleotide nucleotidyltransferase